MWIAPNDLRRPNQTWSSFCWLVDPPKTKFSSRWMRSSTRSKWQLIFATPPQVWQYCTWLDLPDDKNRMQIINKIIFMFRLIRTHIFKYFQNSNNIIHLFFYILQISPRASLFVNKALTRISATAKFSCRHVRYKHAKKRNTFNRKNSRTATLFLGFLISSTEGTTDNMIGSKIAQVYGQNRLLSRYLQLLFIWKKCAWKYLCALNVKRIASSLLLP